MASSRFPGTEGRPLQIRTNLYPLRISNGLLVGIYEIKGRLIPSENTNLDADLIVSRADIHWYELFALFAKCYSDEFENSDIRRCIIRGPSTPNGLKVYVLPAMSSRAIQIGEKQSFSMPAYDRGEVIGTHQLFVNCLQTINIHDQNVCADFKDLMQDNVTELLKRLYFDRGYKLMHKDLYTKEDKQVVCGVIDVLKGMRVRVHTEVKGHPMLSINMAFLFCFRVNIQLLQVYAALFLDWPLEEVDFHADMLKGVTIEGSDLRFFRELVKGFKIKVTQLSHDTFRVLDITQEPASKVYVGPTKLTDHYSNEGYPVLLPLMNAVVVKRGSHEMSVPMEFCMLSESLQKLKYVMEHVKEQISDIVAVAPRPRFDYIDAIGEKLTAALEVPKRELTLLTGLQVGLGPPISLEARVLDNPETTFAMEPPFMAVPFKTKSVKYVFFDLSTPEPGISSSQVMEKFINYLHDQDINITPNDLLHERRFQDSAINPLPLTYLASDFRHEILAVFKKLSDGTFNYDKNCHHLMFFVLFPAPKLYPVDGLKILRETGKNLFTPAGYVSQFMKPRTFGRLDELKIAFNLAMQINAKLGGTNNTPTDANKRWQDFVAVSTMFVGIDTRNFNDRRANGVVTIATSYDTTGMKYRFYRRRINGSSRITIRWEGIIGDALAKFEGPFPKRVLIFRAGMDDNQLVNFESRSEVSQIEAVLKNWCWVRNYEVPKVTFIGYSKSHNVRFMRTDDMKEVEVDPAYEGEMAYNVPRGTVVDHTITSVETFYLVSHVATKGTANPSKYFIIEDKNNIPANDLLFLLHTMSNLTPRSCVPGRRPLPIAYCKLLLNYTFKSMAEFDRTDIGDIPESLRTTPFFI
uniref:Piwi domain-containing protein n=1 Tax=Panagrellus redivivus TaxID=6233 RepID=A0A7E4VQS9_PANRE